MDPESEEHSPTAQDIEEERQNRGDILYELSDIEEELRKPNENRVTGEKSKYTVTDPEIFWDRLSYLRIDYLDKIKDPKLRKDLEGKVARVEREVYKQFVPFIEAQINVFGWHNSPLEERYSKLTLSYEEVSGHFERARQVLKSFKVPKEEQIGFLSELDRLQEKLDRYQGEPTLFSFEKIEEELQIELSAFEFGAYYDRPGGKAQAIDSSGAREENLTRRDKLLYKAKLMKEIADRMLGQETKPRCQVRAASLVEHIEYLKAKDEAPRELLGLEAGLNDLLQRIKNGEKIGHEAVENFGRRLESMKGKKIGADNMIILERLEKLFVKAQRIFSGEIIDEDEERFLDAGAGVNWAWGLLGVDRKASQDEIAKAYRGLALKYHPDISKIASASEKMAKINEAYELILRVKDHK